MNIPKIGISRAIGSLYSVAPTKESMPVNVERRGDRVELSEEAQFFISVMVKLRKQYGTSSTEKAAYEAKVEQVSQSVKDGSYCVDAEDVAEHMMSL